MAKGDGRVAVGGAAKMESSGGVGMLVRLNRLMIDDSPVHEEVDEDHSHHDSPR